MYSLECKPPPQRCASMNRNLVVIVDARCHSVIVLFAFLLVVHYAFTQIPILNVAGDVLVEIAIMDISLSSGNSVDKIAVKEILQY